MDFEELIITNETLNNHLYLSNKLIDVTIKYRHFLINQCKCKCSERNDEFQLIENEYRNVSEEIQRKCKRNDVNHHNEETLPMQKVNEEAKDEDKCDATEVIRSEKLCKKYKFRKKKGNKISHKENRDDENCLMKLNKVINRRKCEEKSKKKRKLFPKRELKGNIISVATDSGTKYQCPECKKLYTDYAYVRDKHIKRTHATEKRFPCPREDCSAVFVCQRYANYHFRNTHIAVKTVKCPYDGCSAIFKNNAGLKIHFKAKIHTNVGKLKKFACEWENCTYKSANKSGLITHMLIHTGDRPYDCPWPGCEKKFRSQITCDEHYALHTGTRKKLPCPWPGCEAIYPTNFKLKVHIRRHMKDASFKCDWPGCEYATYTLEQLTTHKTVHSSERNFPCSWPGCDKRVKTAESLKLHLKIHSGEKPYKCEWKGCEMRFIMKGNMRKHMRVHEKENTKA